jgi:hypothetical protein
MKRSEKQKKLASAAKTVATKIENGTLSIGYSSVAVGEDGTPTGPVGAVLKQAGFGGEAGGAYTYPGAALANVLGTGTEVLPTSVTSALEAITTASGLPSGSKTAQKQRNAALVTALRSFASEIGTSKIRKPYVFSGLYTAQARAAGTFGKVAA